MESASRANIASLVLAAGEGSRMKQVKQLLPWKKTNLLNYHLSQLERAGVSDPHVVLGAYSDQIKQTINKNVPILEHAGWAKGIGSSLQFGLDHILRSSQNYQGLLISLIDQPMIEVKHYKALLNSFILNNDIVATVFDSSLGVPAIIGSDYFKEIKKIPENNGAKFLIKKHEEKVKSVRCMGKYADLDTPENYKYYFDLYGN